MLTPPAAAHAMLLASGKPLGKKELASLLGISSPELAKTIETLAHLLEGSGAALVETDGEVELRIATEAAGLIKKLREDELARDLGKASLETLAVIAYQKGATRGEIDWVRGVNSSASLRTLLMRGLIEGREDERDRRRIRYFITTEALAYLGVSRVENLPRYKELSAEAKEVIREQLQ